MATNLPHSKDLEILRLQIYREKYLKEKKKNRALKKQLDKIERFLERQESLRGLNFGSLSKEDIKDLRRLFRERG